LVPFTAFTIRDDDPNELVVTGMGFDPCGASIVTADTSFNLSVFLPFAGGRTYTLVVTNGFTPDVRDVYGNWLFTAEIPIVVAPFVP
jgi:hypothetical protein